MIFSLKKHVLQYATELPAFQPVTFLSFSNTEHAPHTEVVYAHQASIFRALEARGKHIWVKNNLFNVFVMYALGSVHEKFDV